MSSSKQILLVAATSLETTYLRSVLGMKETHQGRWHYTQPSADVYLLHTGIGMVNTAFALGQYLAKHPVDFAINFGIAGSFDKEMELGSVVEVIEDSFSELGAESPAGFIDLEKMGFPLLVTPTHTYFNKMSNPNIQAEEIPQVRGITVNRVHGIEAHAQAIQAEWNCQVESMEGAAFFYAMLSSGVPFHAYRGISNYVENRNKANWNIPLAAKNVQSFVARKLQHILERLPNSY